MDESNGATPHVPPGESRVIEYASQCVASGRPFLIRDCATATGLKPTSVSNYRSHARRVGIFPEAEALPVSPTEEAGTAITDLLLAVRWVVLAIRPLTPVERTAALDLVREILA